MSEVTLPELGEGVKDATVACWHVKEGDSVSSDDDIVEMVTDKASFNVPAGASGTVKEIKFQEGDVAPIGAILATIE